MSCWQIVWLSSQFGWRRQRHLLPLSNATRQQQLQQQHQQQQQQQLERHCGNNRQTERRTPTWSGNSSTPPPPQGGPCPLLKLLTRSKAFTLTTPISCTASSPLPLSPTLALPLLLAILRLHLLSPEGETFRPQIAFNHCKMQEEILLEASKERQKDR